MIRTTSSTFLLALLLLTSLLTSPKISAEQESKVKVGIIVPLSGPLAFFGKDFVRTYEIAASDNPEVKSMIEVVWEDSAYDSKLAVSAFNKLTSIDKADIVLSFGGPMLHALAPLAEQKKIPFFATESEKNDCKGRNYCSLFRNEEEEWGSATWKVLRDQGKKRIGIVKNQNQFMNTFVNALLSTKKQDEQVTILSDIPPEVVDLRSEMIALRKAEVDALGVYLLPGSHHGLLAAMKNSNVKFPLLFGVEEFLVKENNLEFEEFVNDALVIAPAATDEYREKFFSRYGYSAGFYYTPAFYDFLVLVKDVVKKEPSARGIDLVNLMRFKGTRTGVSGAYSLKISEGGVHSYSFPIGIYKVHNNEPVTLEIIETNKQ